MNEYPDRVHIKRENSEDAGERPQKTPRIDTPVVDEDKEDEKLSLFWFIPQRHTRLCSLKDLVQSQFELPLPPKIPEWSEPVPKAVAVGMALGPATIGKCWVKQAYNLALIRVSSSGRYTITDFDGRSLRVGEYFINPSYDTEEKMLRLVVEILEGYLEAITAKCMLYSVSLYEWRCGRRHWEVKVLKLLRKERLIVLSAEEVHFLEEWVHSEKSLDDSFMLNNRFCSKNFLRGTVDVPFHDVGKMGPGGVALHKLIEDTKAVIVGVKQAFAVLVEANEAEKLLIAFDGEEISSESEELQALTIPNPGPDGGDKFYHWCLERHGNWARTGAFKKATCHEVYHLATMPEIISKHPINWPRGNRSLIPELVNYGENVQKYPWGLPATKLYAAMKNANIDSQYFDLAVRDLLLDLEWWYFKQSKKAKKHFKDLDLQQWPVTASRGLDKKLKGLLPGMS
ncbi:hypothetical protein BDW59DRAFT_163635 [Aspergillus cavernicola]|uniref:Uncharacterized protein n=1 Tax=Aspergillus cavernicola TaxID=176166 RepID=A0ABR4I6C4_9EURO